MCRGDRAISRTRARSGSRRRNSTSTRDHEGKPVPCNLASRREIDSARVGAGRLPTGAIEIFPRTFGNVDGYDDADADLLLQMAEASAKPIHGNVLGEFPASPDGWRRNLAVAESSAHVVCASIRCSCSTPRACTSRSTRPSSSTSTTRGATSSRHRWHRERPGCAIRRRASVSWPSSPIRSRVASILRGTRSRWSRHRRTPTAARGPHDRRHRRRVGGRARSTRMLDLAVADDLETMFAIRRRIAEPSGK